MIIAIDPGLNNAGICLAYMDSSMQVKNTLLVSSDKKLSVAQSRILDLYGTRAVKILAICSVVRDLIAKYDIKVVVLEAPFHNTKTPAAMAALLEVIHAIKYDIIIPFNLEYHLVEPLLVKKRFTGNHMASKLNMREGLVKHMNDATISIEHEIDKLSEHEVDAIAVAYTHFKLQEK